MEDDTPQLDPEIVERARRHAALGDPIRLAIADELRRSDRAPGELARLVGIGSNLLAHHLGVLEQVGLVSRSRSSGDGRRRYVHLHLPDAAGSAEPVAEPVEALFVCTHNSARSQLAAALWRARTGWRALSAGTEPARVVHPRAIAAGHRHGLDLSRCVPRHLDEVDEVPPLVVTVCDRAHEMLDPPTEWLHWSVLDPAAEDTEAAFERVVDELVARIDRWVAEPSPR